MVHEPHSVEEGAGSAPGTLVHTEWSERWPWLVQGVTLSRGGSDGDFALFGQGPTGPAVSRWEALMQALPVKGIVHSRQVHGATVRLHAEPLAGLHLAPPADGHLTRVPGLLLAVTVADCVPVYLLDPERRSVAMVHAGWRGAAAGILEVAIGSFRDRLRPGPEALHVHFGPSICGQCYEVGPEVHAALGEPRREIPFPLDLRANLVQRAITLGVPHGQISRSTLCTLCGGSPFFSHRGGDAGRQVAFLGVSA
jgi:YfiH family protein